MFSITHFNQTNNPSNGGAIKINPSIGKLVCNPATVFIGDLPKDVTQVELYECIKRELQCGANDFDLVLKR